MIVPETLINSRFPKKNRFNSITIIEDELFNDTENPICIICFDGKSKPYEQIKVYKNDTFLGNLGYFEKLRMAPRKDLYVKFNSVAGQIALRAVDGVILDKPIS